MITSTHTFRVRYGETDKMGYVYYGNYAEYFEVGRVELFRSIGISYRELEDQNILMPVLEMHIKYIKPLYYDDEFKLITKLEEIKGLAFTFSYKIFNAKNELCNQASTTLLFIHKKGHKPIRIPNWILEKIDAKKNLPEP